MTPEELIARGERWAVWAYDKAQRESSAGLAGSLLGAMYAEGMVSVLDRVERGERPPMKKLGLACTIHADTPRPENQDDDEDEQAFDRAINRIAPCYSEYKWIGIKTLIDRSTPATMARKFRMREEVYRQMFDGFLKLLLPFVEQELARGGFC